MGVPSDRTVVTNDTMSTVYEEYEEYARKGRIWGQVPRERIKKIRFPRVPVETLDAYTKLRDPTSTISDVLDALGICGAVACSHLPPLIAGKRIAGTAVTVRNIPERKSPTQAHLDQESIRMSSREVHYLAEPRDVLVADFGGNVDVSNMGGQSCSVAQAKGLSGAIVNGAVRDVNTIRQIGFPVWSKGATPKTGKFRVESAEINGPVTVHDVVVHAGDLVVADDSGICFVPFELVDEVLGRVRAIEAQEAAARELIEKDAPMGELKELFRRRQRL